VSGNLDGLQGKDAGQAKKVPFPEQGRRQPCSGCGRLWHGLCRRPALAAGRFSGACGGSCRVFRPGGLTGPVWGSGSGRPTARWLGPGLVAEPSSERSPPEPACFPVSPLFDPGRRPWVECRDAPRPDPFRAPRRAAEGKGGAAWRRDRSHPEPRAAASWR